MCRVGPLLLCKVKGKPASGNTDDCFDSHRNVINPYAQVVLQGVMVTSQLSQNESDRWHHSFGSDQFLFLSSQLSMGLINIQNKDEY